jgi:hypothetical protein
VWCDDDFSFVVRRPTLQPGDGPAHSPARQLARFLPDRGELDMGEAGEVAVVESDDRDLVGHRDTSAQEGVEDADGAVVVEGEDGCGAG